MDVIPPICKYKVRMNGSKCTCSVFALPLAAGPQVLMFLHSWLFPLREPSTA